jgi:hypothetical protein
VRYDLAVAAALRGERDRALELLQGAVSHGLRVAFLRRLPREPAFVALHADEELARLSSH